jgi:hypothetical protein
MTIKNPTYPIMASKELPKWHKESVQEDCEETDTYDASKG